MGQWVLLWGWTIVQLCCYGTVGNELSWMSGDSRTIVLDILFDKLIVYR